MGIRKQQLQEEIQALREEIERLKEQLAKQAPYVYYVPCPTPQPAIPNFWVTPWWQTYPIVTCDLTVSEGTTFNG